MSVIKTQFTLRLDLIDHAKEPLIKSFLRLSAIHSVTYFRALPLSVKRLLCINQRVPKIKKIAEFENRSTTNMIETIIKQKILQYEQANGKIVVKDEDISIE